MFSLRKLAAVTVIGAGLAMPASFATEPVACNAVVEAPGNGRTSDSLGSVCVSGVGYIEAGNGSNGTYVVASSDQFGYVGVSNYENGSTGPCGPADPDGNEGGSGTNSGGCVGTNNNTFQTPVPIACGDGTGPWNGSSRDGCRADQEDVDDLITEIRDLIGQ